MPTIAAMAPVAAHDDMSHGHAIPVAVAICRVPSVAAVADRIANVADVPTVAHAIAAVMATIAVISVDDHDDADVTHQNQGKEKKDGRLLTGIHVLVSPRTSAGMGMLLLLISLLQVTMMHLTD